MSMLSMPKKNRVSHFRGFPFFMIRQLSNGVFITNLFFWLSENCGLTSENIKKIVKFGDFFKK